MAEPFDAARRLLARGAASDAEHAALDRALARDPALRLRLEALTRAILDGGAAELSPAEFGARLHALVEDELDDPVGFRPDPIMAAHLASAPAAAAEREALRALLAALRADALPEPPSYPKLDVSFALAGDSARKGALRRALRRLAVGLPRPRAGRAPGSPGARPAPRRAAAGPPWRSGLRDVALPALALAALLALWLRGAPPEPPSAADEAATARAVASERAQESATSARPTATPATFGPPRASPGAVGGSAATRGPTPSATVRPPEGSLAPPRTPTMLASPVPPGPITRPDPAATRMAPSPAPQPSATLPGYPGELPTLVPTDPVPPATVTDAPTEPASPEPPATATENLPDP